MRGQETTGPAERGGPGADGSWRTTERPAAGTPARWMEGPDAIVALLVREARPGDVILAMSNGSFGGLHKKLLDALAAR